MKIKEEFKSLIDLCLCEKQYVGLGNPNAKILFVGKEAGLSTDSNDIHGSATKWNNGFDYSKPFIPEVGSNLRNKNQTWQKYQKLYDLIWDKPKYFTNSTELEYEITFVENVFTTELSNLHAPRSAEAKKQVDFKPNLKKRKEIFWKHPYISQFSIVVIFSLDKEYIESYPGEICDIFGVKFIEERHCAKNNRFWIHLASKNDSVFPKLVIHTRQLTNGASDDLLENIAQVIRDFKKDNNLD